MFFQAINDVINHLLKKDDGSTPIHVDEKTFGREAVNAPFHV